MKWGSITLPTLIGGLGLKLLPELHTTLLATMLHSFLENDDKPRLNVWLAKEKYKHLAFDDRPSEMLYAMVVPLLSIHNYDPLLHKVHSYGARSFTLINPQGPLDRRHPPSLEANIPQH